jgi:endonuclease/exonuclease/phosphatase family metal-dependent hydrolase
VTAPTLRLFTIAVVWLMACGCSAVRMTFEAPVPACRTMVPVAASPIRWIAPFDADDRNDLRAWCEPVGPVARYEPQSAPAPMPERDTPLVIASWNMAVGEGSLADLVTELDASRADIVLLIQEAYRTKDLPAECPPHSGVANRLGAARSPANGDIVELARRLGMYAVYAPSMRNGRDCGEEPREDRGNAILSTLPLSDIAIIELPFAQQRRVAIAATIRDGSRVLNVISVHFDTLLGHKRQARALRQSVDALQWQDAVVIGGDFNVHPLDAGVREMKRHFTERDCGTGPTHTSGRRLDRLFTLGLDAPLTCETGRSRYGSDHHPLIAELVSW